MTFAATAGRTRAAFVLVVMVVCLSCLSVAQVGARYDNFTWSTTNIGASAITVITPLPNSTISVCGSPAVLSNGACTNKATTYTDSSLGTSCGNSTQVVLQGTSSCVAASDAQGNFGFWGSAGTTYTYTVCPQTGSCAGPFTVTLSSVPYVSTAGTDIGVNINAAFTNLGSQGGRVRVPAGSYNFQTKIVKPRNVILECDSNGGTTLTWNGSSSGTAVVVGDTGGASTYPLGGIDNCAFVGPGTGTASIGVFVGGDPAGVIISSSAYGDHQTFFRSSWQNFGTGLKYGNNAWLDTYLKSRFSNNGTNVLFPSNVNGVTGEGIDFIGCTIANATVKGIQLDAVSVSYDVSLISTSVDFNTAPAITISAGQLQMTDSHIEQGAGTMISQTGGSVTIIGGFYSLDTVGGTDTQMFSITGASSPAFKMEHPILYSNHAVTQAVNYTATGAAKVLHLVIADNYNGTGNIPTLTNTLTQFNGLYVDDEVFAGHEVGQTWNFWNGEQVRTVAAGTSNQTFSICDSNGANCIYVRNNAGTWQFLNSAFSAIGAGMTLTQAGLLTLPSITVNSSVANNGTGLQHVRVAGCLVGTATLGDSCNTTVSWPSTFANSSYTATCTGDGITSARPVNGGLNGKGTTSVTFVTVNGTAAAAQYTNIDCTAMHD